MKRLMMLAVAAVMPDPLASDGSYFDVDGMSVEIR